MGYDCGGEQAIDPMTTLISCPKTETVSYGLDIHMLSFRSSRVRHAMSDPFELFAFRCC